MNCVLECSQTLAIWEAAVVLLKECLENGRSINLEKLGAFTFDVSVDENIRRVRAYQYRPCFVPSQELLKVLNPTGLKSELSLHVKGSIYQKGVRMMALSSRSVGRISHYSQDVVSPCLSGIAGSFCDLIRRGSAVCLDFGFCKLAVGKDGRMKTTFSPEFVSSIGTRSADWPRGGSYMNFVPQCVQEATKAELEAKLRTESISRGLSECSDVTPQTAAAIRFARCVKVVKMLDDATKDMFSVRGPLRLPIVSAVPQ